jgi:hypothetical protein
MMTRPRPRHRAFFTHRVGAPESPCLERGTETRERPQPRLANTPAALYPRVNRCHRPARTATSSEVDSQPPEETPIKPGERGANGSCVSTAPRGTTVTSSARTLPVAASGMQPKVRSITRGGSTAAPIVAALEPTPTIATTENATPSRIRGGGIRHKAYLRIEEDPPRGFASRGRSAERIRIESIPARSLCRRVERAESRSRPALDAALLSPLVRESEGAGLRVDPHRAHGSPPLTPSSNTVVLPADPGSQNVSFGRIVAFRSSATAWRGRCDRRDQRDHGHSGSRTPASAPLRRPGRPSEGPRPRTWGHT